VTIASGGTLFSGAVQTSNGTHDTVTGSGLTINGASGSLLTVNGGSTLKFSLGAGASTGYLAFSTPNMNSTFLTLTDSSADQIFSDTTTSDTVTIVDLTAKFTTPGPNDLLQLRYQNPYLLIATGTGNNSDFANLMTTGGLGSNGYVLGVANGTGGYTAFALNATDINGVALTYPLNNLQLYLYNGDLEIVPEPGTWALMIGGLALLLVVQRRKSKLS